jgi:ABC-type multidrug transport system ATPase subunit
MALELVACTYRYRRRRPAVLQDFSYSIPSGLTVLLGPNGAGKSTLLKLAATVVKAESGTVVYEGIESSKGIRKAVAWMPQDIVPMSSLSAREYVAYVGWLKGMNRDEAWKKARNVLGRVELLEKADAKTHTLSGGQLRRVGVAAALVHGARVLLLDEPTAGMDPHQRRVFRDILSTLAAEDVEILLSTHDVADLAEEADHVSVLYEGQLLHDGSVKEFLSHAPPGTAAGRVAEGAYTALLPRH